MMLRELSSNLSQPRNINENLSLVAHEYMTETYNQEIP